ncbi:Uncharacterized protein PBTT_07145 [Plasmodiophora brassicae]
MHYALLVPVVVATVAGGGAGTWTGQVDLEVDVRDGYTWGIVPRLRNGNVQVARGYVLTLALQNQNHDAIQIVPMTNAVVDSSRSNVGVWSVRPRDAFRLPSGESYSGTAVSVIFHGPLWGTAGCVDASWLHAHVTFLADPTIGSICGDGICTESCDDCPVDCAGTPTCPSPTCNDHVCEPDESCEADCRPATCRAPFASIFGWGLTTTLLGAGLVITILFAAISGMCFRYRSERNALMNDGDDPKVTKQTLRRITDVAMFADVMDKDENVDPTVRRDRQVVSLQPRRDPYEKFEEETAAKERIPIVCRPNLFMERPWAIDSPQADTTQHGTGTRTVVEGVRLPGYLHDMVGQLRLPRRRSSRQEPPAGADVTAAV